MSRCCDLRKYDVKWQKDLQIPQLIQFCGSIKSPEVFSQRLLHFRVFCAMYSLATLIWSFSRFAVRNWAQYWLIYLTMWAGLLVAFYFFTASLLHYKLSRYISDHSIDVTNYFHADIPPNSGPVCPLHRIRSVHRSLCFRVHIPTRYTFPI